MSQVIDRLGDQLHCPGRVTWRTRAHAIPSITLGSDARMIGRKEAVELRVRYEAGQSGEAAL